MQLVDWLSGLFLVKILGIAGLGGLLDSLLREDVKQRLARYIFVPVGTSRDEVDCLLITGLIEAFSTNRDVNRISYVRAMLYSVWSALFLHLLIITSRPISELREDIVSWLLPFLIFGPLLSFPFDFWSIKVKKILFYYRVLSPAQTAGRLLVDVLLCSLPVFVATLGLFGAIPDAVKQVSVIGDLDIGFAIVLGGIISLFGTLCLTTLQLLAVVVANCVRLIHWLLPRATSPLDVTKIYRLPFTICFLLFAMIVSVLQPVILAVLQL